MTERLNIRMSKTRSVVIVLCVLVLLMMGAYYYFFRELRATVEKISTLSNETTSLIAEENNIDSLQVVFSDTTDDRKKFQSYFIQSDGAVDFITTIENLATFTNLTHETRSVKTEEEVPPSTSTEELRLTFRAQGSWQNTYHFISLLESMPYHLSINQINLHYVGEANIGASSTKGSLWEAAYDFSITKLK